MSKKEIRMITASEDVARIIDQGSAIDTELKNLTYKDKGFKSKITEAAGDLLEEGELSVRLEGNTAAVIVTASEKYSFTLGIHERESEVIEAAEDGILGGVVKITKSLHIAPELLDQAVALLNKEGIKATLTKGYSIDTKSYREFDDEGSPEVAAVKGILDECVTKGITYRVKYER